MGGFSEDKKRCVFFDRDGVLVKLVCYGSEKNVSPRYLNDFEIVPDAYKCVQGVRKLGFLAIVVTNQSDVSEGKITRADFEEMRRRLRDALPLDDIFECLHGEKEECECRKPKPGMLMSAAEKYGIDLGRSYMVGDWWRDIDAGKSAGCKTILIEMESNAHVKNADFRVESIADVLSVIENDSKQ